MLARETEGTEPILYRWRNQATRQDGRDIAVLAALRATDERARRRNPNGGHATRPWKRPPSCCSPPRCSCSRQRRADWPSQQLFTRSEAAVRAEQRRALLGRGQP